MRKAASNQRAYVSLADFKMRPPDAQGSAVQTGLRFLAIFRQIDGDWEAGYYGAAAYAV